MGDIEYLDLVDEDDNVIGKEDRNIIYEKELRNFRVINIIIMNSDNKIIVPKRSGNRRIFPNCYDFLLVGMFLLGKHMKKLHIGRWKKSLELLMLN